MDFKSLEVVQSFYQKTVPVQVHPFVMSVKSDIDTLRDVADSRDLKNSFIEMQKPISNASRPPKTQQEIIRPL